MEINIEVSLSTEYDPKTDKSTITLVMEDDDERKMTHEFTYKAEGNEVPPAEQLVKMIESVIKYVETYKGV